MEIKKAKDGLCKVKNGIINCANRYSDFMEDHPILNGATDAALAIIAGSAIGSVIRSSAKKDIEGELISFAENGYSTVMSRKNDDYEYLVKPTIVEKFHKK